MAIRETVPLMRAQVLKCYVEQRLAESVPGAPAIGARQKKALYKLSFFENRCSSVKGFSSFIRNESGQQGRLQKFAIKTS